METALKMLQEMLALQTANVTDSAKRQAREKIIEFFTTKNELNWQDVATPYDIAREMLDLIPSDAENFIVFFSMEFLEEMVKARGIDPKKILFISDNSMEATFSRHSGMYGVQTAIMSKTDGYQDGKLIFPQEIFNFCNEVNMKFGKLAVIANFPYQIQTESQQAREGGKQQAKPLYNLFIEATIDGLNPDHFVSIHPSRWMLGGLGLNKFRERMMSDKHLKTIVDDMSCNGIFPTVDIAGGVQYFHWDKSYNGECNFNGVVRPLNEYDIVLRENESYAILNRVKESASNFVSSSVSSCKPYGLATNVKETSSGTPCWFKKSIGLSFVDSSIVTNPRNDIQKWKVVAPRAPIAGQTDFTKPISIFNDNNVFIAEPNQVCTETYLVINSFDTKKEAENFITYMKTRVFRFMLRMRTVSQDVTRENYAFVPDVQDYSAPWTDDELYKKFNLTRQQIAFIESKIKAI
jgi:site-specific DNA-methyltransferase (adenine-specific)